MRVLDVRNNAVGRGVHDVRLRIQRPLRVPEEQEAHTGGPGG
jgi:hypothetical protein